MSGYAPSAGVIGWPVAHSRSPLIHRFWLAKLGIDGDYGRFAVEPGRLPEAIAALPALGLCGVNVTVPHKVAVLPLLDWIEPEALRLGAVNTVVVAPNGRLHGFNTDHTGFIDPLRALPHKLDAATIIGAGGATRAVLVALRRIGVRRITVINRNPARALQLADDFEEVHSVEALHDGFRLAPADLVVNATPLGMIGQPLLDLQLDALLPGTVVYDLVYAPRETALLADARARGLQTINGLQMLVGQAAAAFELFFGVAPPRVHDGQLFAMLEA